MNSSDLRQLWLPGCCLLHDLVVVFVYVRFTTGLPTSFLSKMGEHMFSARSKVLVRGPDTDGLFYQPFLFTSLVNYSLQSRQLKGVYCMIHYCLIIKIKMNNFYLIGIVDLISTFKKNCIFLSPLLR